MARARRRPGGPSRRGSRRLRPHHEIIAATASRIRAGRARLSGRSVTGRGLPRQPIQDSLDQAGRLGSRLTVVGRVDRLVPVLVAQGVHPDRDHLEAVGTVHRIGVRPTSRARRSASLQPTPRQGKLGGDRDVRERPPSAVGRGTPSIRPHAIRRARTRDARRGLRSPSPGGVQVGRSIMSAVVTAPSGRLAASRPTPPRILLRIPPVLPLRPVGPHGLPADAGTRWPG